LAECAHSGLFDILAHPDLVKVWGGARPLPERDPRFFYEPAVEAIAESGIAVEVSTAGLRKPVGEIYPALGFAEMCTEAGACFALSSDAHLPEQVGFGYDQALEFLGGLGVEEICVFEGRERRFEPLPDAVRED
jgi:histidinol-phosphatase (PHP family)